MTLNELKYIVALAKEKHFRKASEKCFVSQPTLSVAVKKLEEELDVVLFERKKNEVIITPIGEKVINQAKAVLEQIETIKILVEEENQQTSTLKIGAIYTIGPYLLPHLIPRINDELPNTHLIVEEAYTHQLTQKLQQGELDVIFISLPFSEPNIESSEIYNEEFVAALPKKHPLEKQNTIDLNQLETETVLLLGSGHCFRDQVIEAYPKLLEMNYRSDHLQRTLEGSSLETIRYMVASGAGITVLPCTSLQNKSNELLCIKPLKEPIPQRTVIMAWRKTFPKKDLLKRLQLIAKQIKLDCVQSL